MGNPYLELTEEFDRGRLLDRERRALMRIDEERLAGYRAAAEPWAAVWPDVSRSIAGSALAEAHALIAARAALVLPFAPDGGARR